MTITGNEGVSIALIISFVSLACVIISTLGGSRQRHKDALEAEKKRDVEIEKQFVKVNLKLDNFCDTTREMVKHNEKMTDETQELMKQLVLCSERIETLFRYKDDHEHRIADLEQKVK